MKEKSSLSNYINKKTASLVISAALITGNVAPAMADTISGQDINTNIKTSSTEIFNYSNEVKSFQIDVPPQIINGKTMLPARALVESLGGQIEMSPDGKKINITRDNVLYSIDKNNNSFSYKGGEITALIKDGRTLVGVRDLSEKVLGIKNIEWDNTNKRVYIIDIEKEVCVSMKIDFKEVKVFTKNNREYDEIKVASVSNESEKAKIFNSLNNNIYVENIFRDEESGASIRISDELLKLYGNDRKSLQLLVDLRFSNNNFDSNSVVLLGKEYFNIYNLKENTVSLNGKQEVIEEKLSSSEQIIFSKIKNNFIEAEFKNGDIYSKRIVEINSIPVIYSNSNSDTSNIEKNIFNKNIKLITKDNVVVFDNDHRMYVFKNDKSVEIIQENTGVVKVETKNWVVDKKLAWDDSKKTIIEVDKNNYRIIGIYNRFSKKLESNYPNFELIGSNQQVFEKKLLNLYNENSYHSGLIKSEIDTYIKTKDDSTCTSFKVAYFIDNKGNKIPAFTILKGEGFGLSDAASNNIFKAINRFNEIDKSIVKNISEVSGLTSIGSSIYKGEGAYGGGAVYAYGPIAKIALNNEYFSDANLYLPDVMGIILGETFGIIDDLYTATPGDAFHQTTNISDRKNNLTEIDKSYKMMNLVQELKNSSKITNEEYNSIYLYAVSNIAIYDSSLADTLLKAFFNK